jgi:thymidylate synthase
MGLINKLDKQYTDLLQTILEHGVDKKDRTGTGTKSIFGYTIRHNMKDGFPLLTTKKMPFKTIVTELLWFLRGDTNIKFLVDNNCHIWDGDAYKRYENSYAAWVGNSSWSNNAEPWDKENFIRLIKEDERFCSIFGELGPIYGKQWRNWIMYVKSTKVDGVYSQYTIDQIQNLINDLKENPDSRRLMVNAWNVGELDQMVLPPCHYGFQVYTRELTGKERWNLLEKRVGKELFETWVSEIVPFGGGLSEYLQSHNIPTRAISLMWNQRSVDTFLGLPFNIASYGLLLEILAKEVNMVPDQLIGNLGDVHLYSNHLDQAKEQIGREFTEEEILEHLQQSGMDALKHEPRMEYISKLPKRTREPYPLPKLNFNTEWWDKPLFEAVKSDAFCKCLLEEDIQLSNYQSHPTIKAPLSN